MTNIRKRHLILILMAVMFVFSAAKVLFAQDSAKAEQLVVEAQRVFENFKADPDMGWFRSNVKDAKGLFIVPSLLKAGFVWGGSGGSGVFLGHDEKSDKWSYPAFYTMGSDPASILLSINSLTTAAGLSTTSPAAIWEATFSGRILIEFIAQEVFCPR